MRALVIYDSTGRIWSIIYGEEDLPQGLRCMWVDIPDGAQLDHINVTDADNPQPVFSYLPESDIGPEAGADVPHLGTAGKKKRAG